MSAILPPFANSYVEARKLFLAAAQAAGAEIETHRHPLPGPHGAPLYTDFAWLGPADARRVMLTCSGTHGVEGYCGSGCQVAWLQSDAPKNLPRGTAVLLVHAINPFGFAWDRRVNEDNVDINRNFVDHAAPPENELWPEIADALTPHEWDDGARKVMGVAINLFIERHDHRAYITAASSGQFTHADGIFYGGAAPVWSNRILDDYTRRKLGHVKRLAVIDFHTGLGPRGYGELICRHPTDSEALARARRWYGNGVTSPAAGESGSPVIDGNLRMAFVGWLPEAEVTSVAIEYGTYPEDKVFNALVADNWLHLHGDMTTRKGRAIKADIREMFYPDADDWRDAVLERAAQVQARAIEGLTTADS